MAASLYKRQMAAQSIDEDQLNQGITIRAPRQPVIIVGDVDTVLTPAQSGSLVVLPQNTADRTLTLPLPAAMPGGWYEIVMSVTTVDNDWQCTAGAANMVGGVGSIQNNAVDRNGRSAAGVAQTRLDFITAEARLGDGFRCVSTGTLWCITGQYTTVNAFLFVA